MKTFDEIKQALAGCKPGRCAPDCPYGDRIGCVQELHRDTLAMVRQLEAQAPKWISFNEKTPLINSSVLCYGSYEGKPHIYIDYMLVNGTTVMDELYGPTHWMPLPEPPEDD